MQILLRWPKGLPKKVQSMSAAVASKAAAELFGLEILAEGYPYRQKQLHPFSCAFSEEEQPENDLTTNKASFKFVMESKQGSLVSALNILRDYKLDMTKIQSVPVSKCRGNTHFLLMWFMMMLRKFEQGHGDPGGNDRRIKNIGNL